MCVPSGDHVTHSAASDRRTRTARFEPSAFIEQMSLTSPLGARLHPNAILFPSGDQAASVSQVPFSGRLIKDYVFVARSSLATRQYFVKNSTAFPSRLTPRSRARAGPTTR